MSNTELKFRHVVKHYMEATYELDKEDTFWIEMTLLELRMYSEFVSNTLKPYETCQSAGTVSVVQHLSQKINDYFGLDVEFVREDFETMSVKFLVGDCVESDLEHVKKMLKVAMPVGVQVRFYQEV